MAIPRAHILPVSRPRRFISAVSPEKTALVEDLLDHFDFDPDHRVIAGAAISAALRKAAYETDRDRCARAGLAAGQRMRSCRHCVVAVGS